MVVLEFELPGGRGFKGSDAAIVSVEQNFQGLKNFDGSRTRGESTRDKSALENSAQQESPLERKML